MNFITLNNEGQEPMQILVEALAAEGSRQKISDACRQMLTEQGMNPVSIEGRNDAATLLWLATFGPALLSILLNHEKTLNDVERKEKQEAEEANKAQTMLPLEDTTNGTDGASV